VVNLEEMLSAKNAGMPELDGLTFLRTKKNAMKMHRNGTKKIEKLSTSELVKDTQLTKLLLLREIGVMLRRKKLNTWFKLMYSVAKSLNLPFARYVIAKAKELKDIMPTIPNLWKSSGSVINAITTYIGISRNVCSLNDQTLWTLNERMRWPEHMRKPCEGERNISPPIINLIVGHSSNRFRSPMTSGCKTYDQPVFKEVFYVAI
jgi:hypothetical protein